MAAWQELSAVVAGRLADTSTGELRVFAVGVAERLLRQHERLPDSERAPYTLSQRPLLDSLWAGVLGDLTAFTDVKRAVGEYLLSEYCHNDAQVGPADADEPAAAAVLFAADTYLYGCSDFAEWVSGRALEAIDDRLGDDLDGFDDAAVEELRRQLHDLDLIAGHATELEHADSGLPSDRIAYLRAELHEPLSRLAAP
jgi:hypothetical protein